MSNFTNKNFAYQKSQKYHKKASVVSNSSPASFYSLVLSDYHFAVYDWQKKNGAIMPKKLRKKYYQTICKPSLLP